MIVGNKGEKGFNKSTCCFIVEVASRTEEFVRVDTRTNKIKRKPEFEALRHSPSQLKLKSFEMSVWMGVQSTYTTQLR
jgi:hypothetical protein